MSEADNREDVELIPFIQGKPEDSADKQQGECCEYSFCVRGRCLTGPPPPQSRWSVFQYFAQMVRSNDCFCVTKVLCVCTRRIGDEKIMKVWYYLQHLV